MFSFLTLLSLNTFAGAVVLVSGREVAWRLVHSIVQTLAKTMDAVLLRQQLQVNQLLNLLWKQCCQYVKGVHTL